MRLNSLIHIQKFSESLGSQDYVRVPLQQYLQSDSMGNCGVVPEPRHFYVLVVQV